MSDAAWSSGKLYAAITGTNQTSLRSFDPSTFAAIRTLPALTGTPVRLLNLPSDQLLAVTLDTGVPRFHILDAAETVFYDSVRDNTAPVVEGFVIRTRPGVAIDVAAAKIVAGAVDAEGDSIALTAVTAATTGGGSASLSSGIIHYVPAAGFSGMDGLTVTLTDGRGKSGQSVLQVQVLPDYSPSNPPQLTPMPGGQMQLLWQGIPGRTYTIQRSFDLTSWTVLGTVAADVHGVVTFTDNPGTSSAFYRIVVP